MDTSKTIETIKKFYSLVGLENPTKEDKEFIKSFELELAKSMLNEFNENTIKKLVNILIIELE